MALNAQGYFNCLKSYLNTNHYGEPQAGGNLGFGADRSGLMSR
jgi:hypothetical protein